MDGLVQIEVCGVTTPHTRLGLDMKPFERYVGSNCYPIMVLTGLSFVEHERGLAHLIEEEKYE